jgi:subtilisin family serine protease
MEQKEYAVVIKDAADFDSLHDELLSQNGSETIPDRSVDIANYRPMSERITHYALTDEEAEKLKNDPRVESVEIPPHLNPNVIIRRTTSEQHTFTKTSNITSSDMNWAFARCIRRADPWLAANNLTSINSTYDYTLTGRGVDIVIQDSGITPTHYEWLDSNGNSRLQQINWYTASGLPGTQSANFYLDYDGHGSHVASTASGLTQGWGKNARIYAVKFDALAGSEGGGISGTDIFDVIRLWHINKPIDPATGFKRPTVVNMSWGSYVTEGSSLLPSQIFYRGTTYYRGTDYTTLNEMKTNYGWMGFVIGGLYYHSYYSATYEAEVLDMVNAGIHVVVAAGNNNSKIEVFGGPDYNNTWGGYSDSQYHRGGCPGARYAIVAGNLSTAYETNIERRNTSSEQGPGVHVYAPGTFIMGVSSKDNNGSNDIANSGVPVVPSPYNSNNNLMKISGTSMAAPQVTGLLACILEAYPNLTPTQAKNFLIQNCTTNNMYDVGNATSYNTPYSLVGGNNRIIYNPYNVATDGYISNGLSVTNGAITLS